MSDEHGHGFHLPFLRQPTEEEMAEMRRQADQEAMQIEATRHELLGFIVDSPPEVLRNLRAILTATLHDENYGHFVIGQIQTVMHLKHNICPACGKDHDKMLEEAVAPVNDNTEQPTLESSTIEERHEAIDDLQHSMTTLQSVPSPAEEAARIADLMIEYNMRYPNKKDYDRGLQHTDEERPVLCNGCDMLYQSLEDRVRRAPGVDGCHGCQLKSAHG